jgi:hypothetical protein
LHFLGGGIGAGCLWEMEKLIQFGQGKDGSSVTFDKSQVKDIKVGAGWARGSIAWIIAPYVPGINKMAKDMAVSFLAPDGVKPGDTVYALHFRSVDDANKFLDWLKTVYTIKKKHDKKRDSMDKIGSLLYFEKA